MDLNQIITEYGKAIYSFCYYLTQDVENAEDLFQDTFLTVATKQKKLDQEQNIKAYICGIAIRLRKNQERKIAWRQRLAPEASIDEKNILFEQDMADNVQTEAINELLNNETKKQVKEAVCSLTDKYRIVVLLYYMEELTIAEISATLGIPKGTVLSRLDKARKQLKIKLEGYFHEF